MSLIRLNDAERSEICKFFNDDRPFGPSQANGFRKAKRIQELVFSTENEIWKEYKRNPRVIVGRKGSGKTSVLSQTEHLGKFGVVFKPSLSKIIRQVGEQLFEHAHDLRRIDAEISADVWKRIVNVSLMGEVLKKFPDREFPKIEKYFFYIGKKAEGREHRGNILEKSEAYVRGLITSLRSINRGSTESHIGYLVSLALDFAASSEIDFEEALDELDQFLEESDIHAIVILDSKEEYDVNDFQSEAILKGMLRFVGAYGEDYRHVRMAIPAEGFFDLRGISSNPSKDFEDAMVLHWSPIELLRMVAWRYLIFLAGNDPVKLKKFRDLSLSSRDDVHQILSDFLSNEILNRGGSKEYTIAYLLRHSQLLPRQIIKILNLAFSGIRPSVPREEAEIRDSIVQAIRESEGNICTEVFISYRMKYPFIERLCEEVLPNLPRFFSEAELKNAYRDRGKAVLQDSGHLIINSFTDFKRCLLEIGCIGRVSVKEKTSQYADAEFEYAIPGKLSISEDDELCIHPIFSGAFETAKNRKSEHYVYPHMSLYNFPAKRVIKLKRV
ncbi:hypothetical protein LX81_00752 [Palleronia aestuarii]|uniref:Uncharacterized protein n=1 Tax=Palleronia aestuarii TaxID=568105 RepID=A0A2W7NQZ7_9RHOB|nr:hypothetical protein LX81_00752 [Palleronia aestuarii]